MIKSVKHHRKFHGTFFYSLTAGLLVTTKKPLKKTTKSTNSVQRLQLGECQRYLTGDPADAMLDAFRELFGLSSDLKAISKQSLGAA